MTESVSGVMARQLWRAALLLSAALNTHAVERSASGVEARAQPVPAVAHLQAAQRLARRDPALKAVYERACSKAGKRIDASQALVTLKEAESDWRRERERPEPREAVLQQAVVMRSCAAHHATRLQAGSSHAVWLYSKVDILGVQPAATGWTVEARATTMAGPVVGSRITLSRGLHHTCFALSDTTGSVRCTLLDTHPHGGAMNLWAEAHEGPIVATLAGQVTPDRVDLPAVGQRAIPVFVSARQFR